jgi:hypothetical protein
MSDLNTSVVTIPARFHWGAIWAGVFTFLAIWFVFGSLCLAIWAGSPNLNVALSVWGIILTIIAMFVAGRTTGQLAGVTTSREGTLLGMTMFGLAVVSAGVCFVLAFGRTRGLDVAPGATVPAMFTNYGWALFIGLFLGWLAAIGGASSAHKEFTRHVAMEPGVHHA